MSLILPKRLYSVTPSRVLTTSPARHICKASSRLCDRGRPVFSLPTRANMWSTSIVVNSVSELVGSGDAMRTEGTVGVRFRLVGWDGDPIATVLLAGVGGGRGACHRGCDCRTRPRVGVVVCRG